MRERAGIAHAAHGDTQMVSFKIDSDSVWREHGVEGVDNLLTQTFLDGKAFGKESHQSCQFGDADDMFVRNIAHVGVTKKRQRVMLAQGIKWDWSLNYLTEPTVRFPATLGIKDGQEFGIPVVSFCGLKERLKKTSRRLFGRGRLKIHAKRAEYLADVALETLHLLV